MLYLVLVAVLAVLFFVAVMPKKQPRHNRPHIVDLAANDAAYRATHVTEAALEEVPSPVKTVA